MSRYLQVVQKDPSISEQPHILDVERVYKKFNNGDTAAKAVLEDISFSARRGELICILGRSGCGKTTLLNLLAGFIAPDQGIISLNDQLVSQPGPERCVVFQEDALFPWLTVRENIAFGLKGQRHRSVQKEEEIDRFLKLVGLSEFAAYLPGEISGGMKQRVALARVLILKPQVLLMDEPFAALDAQTREEMQNLVLELWQQLAHTILFVTHDVTEAVLLADRILLFDKNPGRIKEDISLELSRPREKEDQNFLSLCRVIRARI